MAQSAAGKQLQVSCTLLVTHDFKHLVASKWCMQSNEKQRDRAGDEEGAWMKEHDRHQQWSKFITTTFEAFRAIVKEKVDADQAIKDSVGPGFTEGYVEVNTPETQAAYGVVQQLQLMRKKFEKVRRHDADWLCQPVCMGCSCVR